jgi:hypothetical protein
MATAAEGAAAQARDSISPGKDQENRCLQILLTWVSAGKYYQTLFPSPLPKRTIAAACYKSTPQDRCSKGPWQCGLT